MLDLDRPRRGTRLIEQLEARTLLSAKLVNTFSDYPTKPTIIGNDVYYMLRSAHTANEALDLYRSDGTAAGTRRIRPVDGQTWVLNPHFRPVEAGGRLFLQSGPSLEEQLWSINGRTGRAEPLWPQGAHRDFLNDLIEFKGLLYFRATDEHGSELWRSDGTPAGTTRFADLVPGPASSSPTSFAATRDHLYFSATIPGSTRRQAWRTDGTETGTELLLLSAPMGSVIEFAHPVVSTADRVYLSVGAVSAPMANKLWASDGITAGALLLEGDYHEPGQGIAAGSRVFFAARTGHVMQLWSTDGTSAGTKQVADWEQDALVYSMRGKWVAGLQGELYVSTARPLESPFRDANKLWRIDSSLRVSRIFDESAENLTILKGKLFFTHNDDLYVSDGTPGGTMAMGIKATEVSSDGNRLFFTHEKQLWTLDPTRGFASGAVWHDVNGNGRREGGEEPLAGFRIFADINRDRKLSAGEPFVRTDAQGQWNLQQLPPGKYPLRMTSVGGWSATTPGVKTVAIRGLEGGQFSVGLRGAPGSIAGTIYDDDNGNGRIEGNDAGLSGFRVFLDLDRDGRLDSGEQWMRSDSRGRYRFDNLPPTTYSIRVTPVEAWRPHPDWQRTVTLSPGALLGANFYLTPSITIRGLVFFDNNRNGLFDNDEWLDRWSPPVYLDLDYDGVNEDLEPYVLVSEGQFEFKGLRRGVYHVRTLAEQLTLYEVVSPEEGYVLINATSAVVYDDIHIGIVRHDG